MKMKPYTHDNLLDLIYIHLGDVDELIEAALYDEACPGACGKCGEVHKSVDINAKDEYCDACGEFAVKSVCVLAGVV